MCQKNFFLIQFKVNIFHQIQPSHAADAAMVEIYRSGSPGCVSGGGGPREHELEALHLLHQGV